MRIRIVGIVAAVAVGLGGYLHLAIWRGGYRFAPVRELFLLNVGISAAVAAGLAFHPRKLTAAAGLVVSLGTLAAFALSRGPGLPTLHGRFTEMALAPDNVRFLGGPAAIAVLAAEAVAVVATTAMLLGRRAPKTAAQHDHAGKSWTPVAA
jgi:hypothetical protein